MERGRGGEREVVGWERKVGVENIVSVGWFILFCGWERMEVVLGIYWCYLLFRLMYLFWELVCGYWECKY